jgi:hypothetical protein
MNNTHINSIRLLSSRIDIIFVNFSNKMIWNLTQAPTLLVWLNEPNNKQIELELG